MTYNVFGGTLSLTQSINHFLQWLLYKVEFHLPSWPWCVQVLLHQPRMSEEHLACKGVLLPACSARVSLFPVCSVSCWRNTYRMLCPCVFNLCECFLVSAVNFCTVCRMFLAFVRYAMLVIVNIRELLLGEVPYIQTQLNLSPALDWHLRSAWWLLACPSGLTWFMLDFSRLLVLAEIWIPTGWIICFSISNVYALRVISRTLTRVRWVSFIICDCWWHLNTVAFECHWGSVSLQSRMALCSWGSH